MSLPDAHLWPLASAWLERETGLHYPPPRWADMQRGLAAAARRLGFGDAAALAARVLASGGTEAERRAIAESLVVGETYFFREPAVFDRLRDGLLAPLVRARRETTRRLRLWSAACSSGEEAYTLAMVVAALVPDWPEWDISILATDLNPRALAKAEAAIYGAWSLRGGIPSVARRFFHRRGPAYAIDDALRRMVRFAPLNLAKGPYPAAAGIDLILCRNVLIYFEPARSREILARLGGCLAAGGWLVTSAVEVPVQPPAGLSLCTRDGVTVMSKAAATPAPAVPAAARRAPAPPAARRQAPAAAAAREAAAAPPREPVPLARAEDPAALARASRASADRGELERAEELCRAAIEGERLNPEWTWLLASILCERGEIEGAMRALQRTLYLDPRHLLARFTLGTLSLRHGKPQAGRKHLSLARQRLAGLPADEVLAGSGGLSAAALASIIERTSAA